MISGCSRLSAAVLLLFVGLANCSSIAEAAPPPTRSSQAVATKPRAADPRLQTIQFESKLVGKRLPYNVLLPRDYDKPEANAKRYPVLYLLHGLFGHYDNWANLTRLIDYSAPYDLIIVMPEGNDNWYIDSAAVPSDKYETYIVSELLPDVQQRFRTIDSRDARAIAGLSMGGYGALKFAAKYPEKFSFAASLSGALGAASWTENDLKGLEKIWESLNAVFGPFGNQTRQANDLFRLYREAPLAQLPFIYLDCGTEDTFFASNHSFSELLLARKIPHEYRERPGVHGWKYWDEQIQEVLRLVDKQFHIGPPSTKPSV